MKMETKSRASYKHPRLKEEKEEEGHCERTAKAKEHKVVGCLFSPFSGFHTSFHKTSMAALLSVPPWLKLVMAVLLLLPLPQQEV